MAIDCSICLFSVIWCNKILHIVVLFTFSFLLILQLTLQAMTLLLVLFGWNTSLSWSLSRYLTDPSISLIFQTCLNFWKFQKRRHTIVQINKRPVQLRQHHNKVSNERLWCRWLCPFVRSVTAFVLYSVHAILSLFNCAGFFFAIAENSYSSDPVLYYILSFLFRPRPLRKSHNAWHLCARCTREQS